MNKVSTHILGILLPVLFAGMTASAQVTITQQVNIQQGIEDSSIRIAISPGTLINEAGKLFDGEPFTEFGINEDDSIIVTLSFNDPVQVSESKTFFMITGGEWSLEAASNEDDLNNKTGSYAAIVNNKVYAAFKWDSVSIEQSGLSVFRLTARNINDRIVHLGEWVLETEKRLTGLVILPDPPRLVPGTDLILQAGMIDEDNNFYDYNLNEELTWSSSNTSVASFNDEASILTGNSPGTSQITVRMISGALTGSSEATVEEDFVSENADTLTVKVAVVYQDPVIGTASRLHQKFGWYDPRVQMPQIVQEFKNISGGVVNFEIVEVHDDQLLFTRVDSEFVTVNQLIQYYNEPGWATIKQLNEQGRLKFDYMAMVNHYDFCSKRNQNIIDEVWVLAHPYAAMYESQLVGKNAFWWNSPPITDTECDSLLSIMGLNYERTVDLAIHSFGHRMESAMVQAYGRWDVRAPNPNNWEIFTRLNKDLPAQAHVGNVHFPPNGTSDYDYGNPSTVVTYADNWKRYPYLLNEKRSVTCAEWNCDQMGYMRWWFSHIPRFKGITKGILNNWWYYFIDYEEAVRVANQTPVVSVNDETLLVPGNFMLEQNFPNPFNPVTTITYRLPAEEHVKLTVHDILGREVKILLDEKKTAGSYQVSFDGSNFASGVYFFRMQAGSFSKTNKMVLLK
jgi:hypothetical protein